MNKNEENKGLAIARNMGLYWPYKSKYEKEWSLIGPTLLLEATGNHYQIVAYEPWSFLLGASKFTPDFLLMSEEGTIAIVEVKGSKHLKSYRDSRSKLAVSSGMFPMFDFWMSTFDRKKGWSMEKMRKEVNS